MDFFKFLLSIVAGFLLSGIWFGLLFLFSSIIRRLVNHRWLLHLNSLLASIISTAIIAITMGLYPLQAEGLVSIEVYLVAILTVLITTAIVSVKKQRTHKRGRELLIYGLDGAFMEIPQRMMMQSFVYGFLSLLRVLELEFYTILATAIIWCMGIVIQALLNDKNFDKEFLYDILASLVFSLGIGYVYQRTGLIIITMVAHFLERILSSCLVIQKIKSRKVCE